MTVHPKIQPASEQERKPVISIAEWRSFNEPLRRTVVPIDQMRTPICDVSDWDGGDYWGGAL